MLVPPSDHSPGRHLCSMAGTMFQGTVNAPFNIACTMPSKDLKNDLITKTGFW
jgi:hypothetical protein